MFAAQKAGTTAAAALVALGHKPVALGTDWVPAAELLAQGLVPSYLY